MDFSLGLPMRILGILFLVLCVAGCVKSTATVDLKPKDVYAGLPSDKKFKEIGAVQGQSRWFVWANCDELVSEVADEMLRRAKFMGGDAVIRVRWLNDFNEPTCNRRLGWFALLIYPGFGPWVTNAEAEGVAVKFE